MSAHAAPLLLLEILWGRNSLHRKAAGEGWHDTETQQYTIRPELLGFFMLQFSYILKLPAWCCPLTKWAAKALFLQLPLFWICHGNRSGKAYEHPEITAHLF